MVSKKIDHSAVQIKNLNLPNWENFDVYKLVHSICSIYKEEQALFEKLLKNNPSVRELFSARSQIMRKVLAKIEILFFLERVAANKHKDIFLATKEASRLIEEAYQWLTFTSAYPDAILRLNKEENQDLTQEERWYLSREADEFASTENLAEADIDTLKMLSTELDAIETNYRAGDTDNDPLVMQMLKLRSQIAKLENFSSFNEQKVSKLMMASMGVRKITSLLNKLEKKSREFKKGVSANDEKAIFKERYSKADVFQFIETVLCEHFGITLKARKISVWARGVLYFDVLREGGELIGGLYYDLYARKGKINGYWTAALRHGEESILPLTAVVTDFNSQNNFSHNDLTILIHETGHAIHHLLSKPSSPFGYVRYLEDDAREISSILFERFACDTKIIEKVLTSKNGKLRNTDKIFLRKFTSIKRAHYVYDRPYHIAGSIFDWNIHLHPPKDASKLHAKWLQIREQVIPDPKADKKVFPKYFKMIFDGTHSGILLTYTWGDIVAAQLYKNYQKVRERSPKHAMSLISDVYKKGSSAPMIEILKPLLGGNVSTDAYIEEMTG